MKKYLAGIALIALITGCAQKNTTVVTVGDKDGILNESGEVQVKPVYKKMGKLDTISTNNYKHPHYVNLHWLHIDGQRYSIVKNIDNKYGIVDDEGNLKLKVIFDSIGQFVNGFAKVEVDGKYGLINEDLEVVLKPIYDDVRNPIDEAIVVKNFMKNDRIQYGCLNTNMELIAPLDYDMIFLSNEKRMRVKKDNLWGFMDTRCNLVVKPQYKFAKDFSNGLAKVQKTDGLFTYINLAGEEIERKTFDEGLDF
ncbi:WG repeat-containing protein [Halarcobacter sp.]|uniref:WG repeat-containing protein n=1 Tax=Halarcobacter sp. TaxID=2321133 RepID=UPI0029F5BD9B|nr:WG repeat-containing protein [Halarcobacter sp.]